MGLSLSQYLVTEAGFGSDLGAEKFFDLKCRSSGLRPAAAVIVATLRAVEYHGGFEKAGGWDNLSRHIDNVRSFGVEPVVAINRFPQDSRSALAKLKKGCEQKGVRCEYSDVYTKGSPGGVKLARAVVEAASAKRRRFRFLYPDDMPLKKKIETIATKIYKARQVYFSSPAARQLAHFEAIGYGHLPICMAKTPMSFTENPKIRGAPEDFDMGITDVMLSAGAGFVVAIAGQVIPMPGLPKVPAALRVKIDSKGNLLDLA
jgi:formate--tetrahydrofolate ligase